MSGQIFFDITSPSTSQSVVVVPQTAISHKAIEGDCVWIVNAKTNQVTRRKVSVGALEKNGLVSIVDGVEEGELVVLSSLRFLSEGMYVKIAK